MTRKLTIILFLIIESCLIFGCSHKDDIEGRWASECLPLPLNDVYHIITQTFDRGQYNVKVVYYADSDCMSEDEVAEERSGAYVVGEPVITSDGIDAKKLQLVSQRIGEENSEKEFNVVYAIVEEKLYIGNSAGNEDGTFSLSYEIPYYRD